MSEFNCTLSNKQSVRIVNPGGASWTYEVYSSEGDLLGTVFTDGNDGTEDEALKPFEAELLKAIYDHGRPEL